MYDENRRLCYGVVSCLEADRETLVVLYDFAAEHRINPRTTNPIESTSSSVRLRTNR
jgi:transposase-like protein